jgi:transposase
MSTRRRKKSLPDPKDQRIAELEAQLAQAQAIIQKMQKQLERLQAEVDALRRAGKRQATPFARRKWVAAPRKPGRKAGQGKFAHREKPEAEQVQRTQVTPLEGCPECGSHLRAMQEHEQYVADIPVIQPVITRYVTFSGYCPHCHTRVRSQHPEQTSSASGAAGVLVGPRAKALAADLKHRLGASYAKVSEALNDAFGLRVTRSGWCQADQRLAETARPVYQELVETVRQCSVVHADETGWRIGTLSAWLWVFTNQEVSVYAIRDNRSSDVVIDVLGQEFKGILVSDCFLAYDEKRLADWLKQKCVGHLLRDLHDMQESKSGRAVRFAQELTAVLQAALALKTQQAVVDADTFSQQAQALEARLDALIAPQRRLKDADNARFAKRLRKHRPHLLRFLYVDDLDATNNLAERMLRPAVITRKTNGCNRTNGGAETHAILSSILVTCRQHSVPILDYLVKLQQGGDIPPPLVSSVPAPT